MNHKAEDDFISKQKQCTKYSINVELVHCAADSEITNPISLILNQSPTTLKTVFRLLDNLFF